MTYFYYKTNSWSSQPQVSEDQIEYWKHLSEKKNWRITQLPNGYYQTEFKNQDDSKNCDIRTLENDFISIVPIQFDLTSHDSIEFLGEYFNK